MIEATIPQISSASWMTIFGARDQHLKKIRETFQVDITHRGGEIRIRGEEAAVAQATEAIEQLRMLAGRRGPLEGEDVARMLDDPEEKPAGKGDADDIHIGYAGRIIRPRTPGQAKYIAAIRKNDLVFAVGPAGTGKTYLAVAMAVEALKAQRIRKIVMVRPAVEAGERLGFLPGDLQAKINPYLRPLFDALREMLDFEMVKRYTEQDVIEVIPLAYMRGRTLNEAFIVLDEAQNTTVSQMKMFLTRMGQGSKIVVSGDTTQNDLPPDTRSGLTDAISRLKHVKGFKLIQLGKEDIVRHRLVQEIVQAYESDPRKRKV